MSNGSINRRSFLYGASVAGFGIFARGRHGWAGGVGPNEVLNIACIGVGGKGESDTEHAGASTGGIVALCDIDEKRARREGREVQGREEVSTTSASCSTSWARRSTPWSSRTPDHTHAPAAVMAMRLGKHVYCQKPLTHSVWEARLMRETARREGGLHPDGQPGDGPSRASAAGSS